MSCAVCGAAVAAFLPHGLPPRPGRCPACGAKARHRALALLARELFAPRLATGAEILEIGPSRVATERLAPLWAAGGARYTAVDLRPLRHHGALRPPHRALLMDARVLAFPGGSFDLVLCANVLCYVPEDALALAEIRRVLKPGGLALLLESRGTGPTESAAGLRARRPELDDEWFAENGTAWSYGEDFEQRVSAAGLLCAPLEPPQARGAGREALGLKASCGLLAAARSRDALERWTGGWT